MLEKEIQKEQALSKIEENKKRQAKGCLVIFLVLVIFVVLIFIGNDSKNVVKPEQQLQQGQTQEDETKIEPDFKITAEELYSIYVQANDDSSVWKKYDGEIVEITGMVTKVEDVVEVFKNSSAYSTWVKRYGETIPSFVQSQIDEGRRYYICLADKEGYDRCVVWAYSNYSQLINGIKTGERVTVVGKWKWNQGAASDLINSEIKKIY